MELNKTFIDGLWSKEINVTSFVQTNITPYVGDASFLQGPTDRTKHIWNLCLKALEEERANNGVRSLDNKTVSTITSHKAGYIDKEQELIVGLQTDQLLKRAMLWGGGVAMLCAVGMNVVGRPLIGLLFGERYLAAIDLLLPISFYVVPVACLTILINYLMPLGRSGFFAVSMAAGYLLIFVLVSRFHHSVAQMLYIMGGGLLLVLAANLIYIALAPQKEKATV